MWNYWQCFVFVFIVWQNVTYLPTEISTQELAHINMWKLEERSQSHNSAHLTFFLFSDSRAGEGAPQKIDHALIGGVVAVVMFAILCALIVLGRYFARHKGNAPAVQSYLIMNAPRSWSVFGCKWSAIGFKSTRGQGSSAQLIFFIFSSSSFFLFLWSPPTQELTSHMKPKGRTTQPTRTRPSSMQRADTTTQMRRRSTISKAGGPGVTGGNAGGWWWWWWWWCCWRIMSNSDCLRESVGLGRARF